MSSYTTITETETSLYSTTTLPISSELDDKTTVPLSDSIEVLSTASYPQSSESSYRLLSNGTSHQVNVEEEEEEEEEKKEWYTLNLQSLPYQYVLDLGLEFCTICNATLSDYSLEIFFYTFISDCLHTVCSNCYEKWPFKNRCMSCNSISVFGYEVDKVVKQFFEKMISFTPNFLNIFTFKCRNCMTYYTPNYPSGHYFNKIYYDDEDLYCGFCAQSFQTFGKRKIFRSRFLEFLFDKFYQKKKINKKFSLFIPSNPPHLSNLFIFKVIDITIFDGYIKTIQLEIPSYTTMLKYRVHPPHFIQDTPLYLIFPSYINVFSEEIIKQFIDAQYIILSNIEISIFPSISFLHVNYSTKFSFIEVSRKERFPHTPTNEIIDFFSPVHKIYFNEIF